MPLQREQRLRALLAVQRRHDMGIHVVYAAERPIHNMRKRPLRLRTRE